MPMSATATLSIFAGAPELKTYNDAWSESAQQLRNSSLFAGFRISGRRCIKC
jgi:hypothetical protein